MITCLNYPELCNKAATRCVIVINIRSPEDIRWKLTLIPTCDDCYSSTFSHGLWPTEVACSIEEINSIDVLSIV